MKSHLFAVFSILLIFLFNRWTRDGNQTNTFNFQKSIFHLKVSTSSFSINSSIKTCKLHQVKYIWKWKILNDKLTPESHIPRSCLTKRSFKNTRSVLWHFAISSNINKFCFWKNIVSLQNENYYIYFTTI